MADTKISNLTGLAAAPATDDVFALVDTSASSTKKLDAKYLVRDSGGSGAIVTGAFTLTLQQSMQAAGRNVANTFTAAQTIGNLNLNGNVIASTSGAVTVTPLAGQNLNVNLSTTGDFVVNTNQFYVDTSTGKVGIGTTLPVLGKLQVESASNLVYFKSTTSTNFSELQLSNTTNSLQLGVEGSSGGARMAETIAYCGYLGTYNNYPLTLHTNNANRMTILGNGNVLIGTTTNSGKLTVNGEIALVDGMTAPSTGAGWAKLYVDSADGDLKIKFGDGTVKTIVVDT